MESAKPSPPVPQLPVPDKEMTWRDLNWFREQDRGEAFYVACLSYAHQLWRAGLPARAILCLDRAWGADLRGDEPALERWPLPYAALAFMLRRTEPGVFLGNPRVHFQHYADRLGEPRKEQRKWRAWACWAITRRILPELPGDPAHPVEEPSEETIGARLGERGLPGEVAVWRAALEEKA